MTELKHCPFCGGETEKITYPYNWKEIYVLMCKWCKARSAMFDYTYRHFDFAISEWNRRANDERSD